jgi:hypothetical protein
MTKLWTGHKSVTDGWTDERKDRRSADEEFENNLVYVSLFFSLTRSIEFHGKFLRGPLTLDYGIITKPEILPN